MKHLKFKKVAENATTPEFVQFGWDLKATKVQAGPNNDNTPLVVYETGIEVTIPEGFYGILFSPADLYSTSLAFGNNPHFILGGVPTVLAAVYKITSGNALSKVYKEGDTVARLLIFPIHEFKSETEEYVEPEIIPDSETPAEALTEADDQLIGDGQPGSWEYDAEAGDVPYNPVEPATWTSA